MNDSISLGLIRYIEDGKMMEDVVPSFVVEGKETREQLQPSVSPWNKSLDDIESHNDGSKKITGLASIENIEFK